MALCSTQSFDCSLVTPGRSRAWLREQLGHWLPPQAPQSHLVDDAELCVSELVTNAVTAGCRRTTLQVELIAEGVRLSVTDDAGGQPVQRLAGSSEFSGRGLALIAALAVRWGVEPLDTGKRVWAELAGEPVTSSVLEQVGRGDDRSGGTTDRGTRS